METTHEATDVGFFFEICTTSITIFPHPCCMHVLAGTLTWKLTWCLISITIYVAPFHSVLSLLLDIQNNTIIRENTMSANLNIHRLHFESSSFGWFWKVFGELVFSPHLHFLETPFVAFISILLIINYFYLIWTIIIFFCYCLHLTKQRQILIALSKKQ
jgi:hypothetical protein